MPLPPDCPPPATEQPLVWDIFCHVVDNLGDIGVCWRLCAGLAHRQHRVRLWIDQPEPLRWMVPGALEGRVPGVQVIPWSESLPPEVLDPLPPADVWIEAFGCDPPVACIDALARRLATGAPPPVWINLEYLSAEAWVERSHGLPSPVMSGPLKGLTKWFLFPGFTPATGGLLREPDLPQRQESFDAPAWLRSRGWALGQRRVSVFCYEPEPLPDLLTQASAANEPAIDWLVTAGRAAAAVQAASARLPQPLRGQVHPLPRLPHPEFDRLLWASDLNLVRGEDSLVRALWAGRPFVWHIYPQEDHAHHAKLEAFLDWLQAPPSLRRFHRIWNGLETADTIWPGWAEVDGWTDTVQNARQRLTAQPDLATQLLGFVNKKR